MDREYQRAEQANASRLAQEIEQTIHGARVNDMGWLVLVVLENKSVFTLARRGKRACGRAGASPHADLLSPGPCLGEERRGCIRPTERHHQRRDWFRGEQGFNCARRWSCFDYRTCHQLHDENSCCENPYGWGSWESPRVISRMKIILIVWMVGP